MNDVGDLYALMRQAQSQRDAAIARAEAAEAALKQAQAERDRLLAVDADNAAMRAELGTLMDMISDLPEDALDGIPTAKMLRAVQTMEEADKRKRANSRMDLLQAEIDKLRADLKQAQAAHDQLAENLDFSDVLVAAQKDENAKLSADLAAAMVERDAAQERVDLDVDAFLRIKADLDNLRVGILPKDEAGAKAMFNIVACRCDRAVIAGRQNVTLIEQRDRAEQEARKLRVDLAAAQQALHAATEWRPIETAPRRDGTRFVTAGCDDRMQPTHWLPIPPFTAQEAQPS